MSSEQPLVAVAVGLVTTFTLLTAFTLLAIGFPFFWVAFPIGFGGVLPAAIGLAKWYGENADQEEPVPETPSVGNVEKPDEQENALAVLRNRYARGDINEEEFERRLEQLLETDSVENATAYMQRERSREPVAEKE
jgi:hypothetical protein